MRVYGAQSDSRPASLAHAMLRAGQAVAACAVIVLVGLILGCEAVGQGQLQQQNEKLSQQLAETQKQLAEQTQLLDAQAKRIDTLLALGSKRLDLLYYPVALEIERLSGGYDEDGQPGDDGVVTYLRPVDQDGHAIKTAGTVQIELFDLASPDGQRLVGKIELDLQESRKLWYGRLWTQHYTVKCPWRGGRPPRHPAVTIRATFTDYLTGKTLEAQQLCEVKLPPGQ